MAELRLRDQRDMHRAASVDDVRTVWAEFVGRNGLELVADDRTVAAYVNHGRWVADCPECNGGIACWENNPAGCCLDCGHIFVVEFPSKSEMSRAVKALVERPAASRNWRPDKQAAAALQRENTLMRGVRGGDR